MSEVATPRRDIAAECDAFRAVATQWKDSICTRIVGLGDSLEQTLWCLLANGHILLEGVPGLGKTLLVQTISESAGLRASRIQCTPDLMPADVLGTTVLVEDPVHGGREHKFRPGPIFTQVLLADELNRATPRSQSALLEAMQERSVSVGGKTYQLDKPFLVLATQNPIEQEGTHPLPEAQLDRFMAKIEVPSPSREALRTILERTTSQPLPALKAVITPEQLLAAQQLAREVVAAPQVLDWAIRLVLATQPGSPFFGEFARRYIRCGASPRGAQSMVAMGKVRALLAGRYALAIDDLRAVALPALRHRLGLTFEADGDRVDANQILQRIMKSLPVEAP
ncbi:MAG: AAA family ATPase [Planctomycetes bacterium]|nr:AAA family ATPase [Planctomycetota bacterium]